jgi:lysophospholipase L1-like esterase
MAVNSLGMRDTSPRVAPLDEPGTDRLLFLGDSFTEGVGVSYEDTFVCQTERLLNSGNNNKPVRCLNGGVASYSPILELVTLRELLSAGLRVSGIVLALDISDPQDELLYRTALGTRYEHVLAGRPESFHSSLFIEAHLRSAFLRRIVSGRVATNLKERAASRLWRDDYWSDRNAWFDDPELLGRWGRKGIHLLERALEKIIETAAVRELTLLVVIYPWPAQLDQQRAKRSAYEEAVHELCRRRGVRLLDLYSVFAAERNWKQHFIVGDVHWTPSGHRLVAREVASSIASGVPITARVAGGPRRE